MDGTEEEGSLETFLKTKADKHTSRGKRRSGLNEDTAASNTESDDDGDVNADSESDEYGQRRQQYRQQHRRQ